VSISVTGKQHDLEKQHAGGPHTRTAAKPREDKLADHGLNLKEQKGAEKAQQGELQIHGEKAEEESWQRRLNCNLPA
jgi:hypothetical protein